MPTEEVEVGRRRQIKKAQGNIWGWWTCSLSSPDMVGMDSEVSTQVKIYQIMYLNYVKFIVHQLFLSKIVKNKAVLFIAS